MSRSKLAAFIILVTLALGIAVVGDAVAAAISDIYTDVVYHNLQPLYANWEPTKPIQLGDYGVFYGRMFHRMGNIADSGLGIEIGLVQESANADCKWFASQGSSSFRTYAKGEVMASGALCIKPALEVKFSSDKGVFFRAANCHYMQIADKQKVANAILAYYKAGKWAKDWVVVTDLVRAGATAIAISGGQSGSIVFEATGNVKKIDLANATLGLALNTSTNVAYQVVSEQGLTPLLGFYGLKHHWIRHEIRLDEVLFDNRVRGPDLGLPKPTEHMIKLGLPEPTEHMIKLGLPEPTEHMMEVIEFEKVD